jgi:hypothetical protein
VVSISFTKTKTRRRVLAKVGREEPSKERFDGGFSEHGVVWNWATVEDLRGFVGFLGNGVVYPIDGPLTWGTLGFRLENCGVCFTRQPLILNGLVDFGDEKTLLKWR